MSTHTFEYQSEYARRLRAEGEAQGEARGEAKALLLILGAREWQVTGDLRRRVDGCTDSDQLNRWLVRAANATSLDEVFD
ncbi:hypothetical protein Athai_56590 [Actinocatenispora thailandica]|uniref:Uncharacterized protein n=1 Tax=Actinocatenispora thailandica TaxID=227318 RepID=A0A7R7DV01_9ACTN|nr:hypothetical protein [Actinocatenispora thailandica]BCJ38156.1 hypothetical protein Athai_56590 [Actinocatenispora thailandica]